MDYAVGFIAGIAFMRIMNWLACRPCCWEHFQKHAGESCQHKLCNASANHYGYCNLHWWLHKGAR